MIHQQVVYFQKGCIFGYLIVCHILLFRNQRQNLIGNRQRHIVGALLIQILILKHLPEQNRKPRIVGAINHLRSDRIVRCKNKANGLAGHHLFNRVGIIGVDRENAILFRLLQAKKDPENHKDIVVRVCGFANETQFCQMLELTDYVMFDLKLADAELHRRYTGVSNERILKNLDNLRQSGKPFVLRTPLIPGITDTAENLAAIREIVKDDPWETLPYNPLTESKYERIGKEFCLNKMPVSD